MWVSPGSSSSMEVETVQINDLVNCADEQADEQSLSPEVSDVYYDIHGDPDIFPRVGEEYQAEIPPLISESDYYRFQRNSHKAESSGGTLHKFRVGLPIPLIWISDEVESNKHDPLKKASKSVGVTNKVASSKLECIQETQNGLNSDKLNPKLEPIDSALVNRLELRESENSNVDQETKMGHEKHRDKRHCLVPGSASDTWNEIEEACFVLGLYIFGKNLVQVKRFVGNKNMGAILSFYYGKFFKSNKYQRWAGCRKMKSRKCIFGQKIFTGPRQQELLSRLQPNVPEESRNKLLEVSKTFVEGKMLLEDYVLTLKAFVGLKALVEGVGVGKGKEDLTGFTVDSMKFTQSLHVRQEIPAGKACSLLTNSEIISFLTGDFRLSKARTSDLFWEAVWPRLLAKGWHSEQPRSYNYAAASKHTLVFLVPGVKKFTRKLVKGNHYFDSVTDVLGKVASDPELIELADNDCTGKEGNGWTKDTRMDRENSPDQPRHCYLKAKTPNRSTDTLKFTVVDTSLASENTTKVRELRSLPFAVLNSSTSESDLDDENSSEEQTNDSESVNTICFGRGKNEITKDIKCNSGKSVSSDLNGLESKPSKEELPRSSMCSLSPPSKDQKKTDFLSNPNKRDSMKCQSLKTMVSDDGNDLVPVTKRRRRLTSCSRAKKKSNTLNFFVVPKVKQEEAFSCPDADNSKSCENVTCNFFVAPGTRQEKPSYCAYNLKFTEDVLSCGALQQENKALADFSTQENKALTDPLSNSTGSVLSREPVLDTSSSGTKDQLEKPIDTSSSVTKDQHEKPFDTSCSETKSQHEKPLEISSSGTKDQHEKPQQWAMIDLNLPVSPEVEADEPVLNEAPEIKQNNRSNESEEPSARTNSKPVDHTEHQPETQTRRQSTRNRPPTTKVLEAFAFGYMDRKEKRKSQDSSITRPSRRVSRKVTGSNKGVGSSGEEEKQNAVCNGNGSTSCESNVIHTGPQL